MEAILKMLGGRMRQLREKRGLSQQDFATDRGPHRTAVGLLERGKSIPRLDTLLIISEGFGITVSSLLQGLEEWGKRPSRSELAISKTQRKVPSMTPSRKELASGV